MTKGEVGGGGKIGQKKRNVIGERPLNDFVTAARYSSHRRRLGGLVVANEDIGDDISGRHNDKSLQVVIIRHIYKRFEF